MSFYFSLSKHKKKCQIFTDHLSVCLKIASETKWYVSFSFLQTCACSGANDASGGCNFTCPEMDPRFPRTHRGTVLLPCQKFHKRPDIFEICDCSKQHQNSSLQELSSMSCCYLSRALEHILKFSDAC